MGEQRSSWYVRGKGNQPTGPFTAEELIQSVRAGRLDPNTICWCEGMSQWLPLSQMEPFASAISSAIVSRPAARAQSAQSPAPRAAVPSSLPAGNMRAGQRQPSRARIWAIGGGIAAICAIIGGALLVVNWHHRGVPTGEPHAAARGEDSASQNWGDPVRVGMMSENREVQTTFLVGLKDAWYTDYGSSGVSNGTKTFLLVYSYKNLGPREGRFSLGPGLLSNDKAEIKTDKGHIFSGHEFSAGQMPGLFGTGPQRHDVGGWQPKETTKIEETGESALVFEAPHDEVPCELITSGSLALDVKLPQGPFAFRRYSQVFGFLPKEPEKAVPGLIELLGEKDQSLRNAALETLGGIGPAAKDAVPALVHVLQYDEWTDVRAKAAKTLGDMGPAAKEAILALRAPLGVSRPIYGGVYTNDLLVAAREAIVKIDPNGASVPPTPHVVTPSRAGPQVSLPRPTQPELSTPEQPPHKPLKKPRTPRTPRVTPPADENPLPKGSLSGTWQNTVGGRFRIDDDGTTARVTLISSNVIRALSGELTRPDGDEDGKSLSGTFEAAFKIDAPKQYRIRVTATLDDSGQLQLQCADCPVWNKYGKKIGTRTQSETWTRRQLGRAGNTSATRKTDGRIRLSGQ